MEKESEQPEVKQYHLKLGEWRKLEWLIGHAERRIRRLTGMARATASPPVAVDMAIDQTHAILSNPDLMVISRSATLAGINEEHLAAVERTIMTMFGPDYKNLRITRGADGSLSGAHDGQKAAGGKSAVFRVPAQMFGEDRGEQRIGELLNRGRPASPMVE